MIKPVFKIIIRCHCHCATLVLRKFVTNCDMLHMMFFNFWFREGHMIKMPPSEQVYYVR